MIDGIKNQKQIYTKKDTSTLQATSLEEHPLMVQVLTKSLRVLDAMIHTKARSYHAFPQA